MNTGCQHGRSFITEIFYIDKAVESSRLIMVVPKESRPAIMITHFLAPSMEEAFELFKVKSLKRPLLSSLIVHLEMMEIKGHRQFLPVWCSVKNAIFNRRCAHFADRHNGIILPKGCFVHHTQIVMDDWLVRVCWLAVIFWAVLQYLVLTNQVDHIKAESFDALVPPEIHHLEKLLTNIGIAPIEICLGDIKKVQIIFTRIAKRRPGTATKLG